MSVFNYIKNSSHMGKGIFQTDLPSGLVFYAVKMGEKLSLTSAPVKNNDEGVMSCMEIMDADDFVDWAVDPWTGECNLEVDEL